MSVSHAQLKAFHAVAVYGSFTRAAERLFLTQPAVSDQVRKLEERYGVLLFHRNKRSVRLSELGERLLAVTQRLFAIEAEAEELLSASSALQTGTLTLAVDAPVHVLPQIARFCERYPGIAVRVETGNTDESLQRLFSYQADLALLGRDVSDERLLSLTLRNDPIVAFVSLSHPWAGRESIRLADLDDMPLVLREQGSVTRQTLEEEMSRAGLRIRPAIQVEGREASREAVVAGIGVGVVSAAEFGADTRVHALPIVDCQRRLTETWCACANSVRGGSSRPSSTWSARTCRRRARARLRASEKARRMPGFEVVLAGTQACFCSCSRDLSSSRQARWIITSVIGISRPWASMMAPPVCCCVLKGITRRLAVSVCCEFIARLLIRFIGSLGSADETAVTNGGCRAAPTRKPWTIAILQSACQLAGYRWVFLVIVVRPVWASWSSPEDEYGHVSPGVGGQSPGRAGWPGRLEG